MRYVVRRESTNVYTRTYLMVYNNQIDSMFDMKSLAKGICLATNIARNQKNQKPPSILSCR
jgi:hypothetical protein